MYQLNLTQSLIPAQTDEAIKKVSIGAVLDEIASKYPNKVALVEVDSQGKIGRSFTFGELLTKSELLASALLTRFKSGEHVAIWAPNIPEWIIMQYACALAGLVLVTVNPALQAQELRYILENSDSVALFLVKTHRSNPMWGIAQEATKGNKNIREITNIEDTEALYKANTKPPPLANIRPSDAAQIQYTSGTTGLPKGVVLSHIGLVNNSRFYANRLHTHIDTIWVNMMPLFHTSGCGMVTLGCLQFACKMLLVKNFNAERVAQLIASAKGSTILGVPTMLIAIFEVLEQKPYDMSSLEVVSCGGAVVSPGLVKQVTKKLNSKFSTLYGQTEASPVITQHYLDDSFKDICNTIGQPLPQLDVCIMDSEKNYLVPIGEVGEICVRGYSLMDRYYNNPQSTLEAIDQQGWLHTGDLGKMDARGYLYITGRLKEIIIRGGENHFPAEIEHVIASYPTIIDVAVIGLPDKKWGELICCCFRSEKTKGVDINELHNYCRQRLSPQKTPTLWYQVDEFPMTGSRKIQKHTLRDKALKGEYKQYFIDKL